MEEQMKAPPPKPEVAEETAAPAEVKSAKREKRNRDNKEKTVPPREGKQEQPEPPKDAPRSKRPAKVKNPQKTPNSGEVKPAVQTEYRVKRVQPPTAAPATTEATISTAPARPESAPEERPTPTFEPAATRYEQPEILSFGHSWEPPLMDTADVLPGMLNHSPSSISHDHAQNHILSQADQVVSSSSFYGHGEPKPFVPGQLVNAPRNNQPRPNGRLPIGTPNTFGPDSMRQISNSVHRTRTWQPGNVNQPPMTAPAMPMPMPMESFYHNFQGFTPTTVQQMQAPALIMYHSAPSFGPMGQLGPMGQFGLSFNNPAAFMKQPSPPSPPPAASLATTNVGSVNPTANHKSARPLVVVSVSGFTDTSKPFHPSSVSGPQIESWGFSAQPQQTSSAPRQQMRRPAGPPIQRPIVNSMGQAFNGPFNSGPRDVTPPSSTRIVVAPVLPNTQNPTTQPPTTTSRHAPSGPLHQTDSREQPVAQPGPIDLKEKQPRKPNNTNPHYNKYTQDPHTPPSNVTNRDRPARHQNHNDQNYQREAYQNNKQYGAPRRNQQMVYVRKVAPPADQSSPTTQPASSTPAPPS